MKDTLRKIGKIIGVYAGIYVLCSVIFVALFHTSLLSKLHVLMYRGIVYLVLAGIVAAVCMGICRMRWKSLFDVKDIVLMFLGFCCVNMVLFTLIPVTVERSVSVFTLSYMMENPGVYTVSDMEDIFHKTYVCEFQAFDKRFEEQIISGNVEEKDGGYVLTKRGEFTVNFFRTISSLFNTDERLIYPNENTE